MKTQATRLYPFVPSGADFQRAIRFFEELGFVKEWGDEQIAGMRFGGAYFLLQNIEVRVWQENQMITFEVTSLDEYWRELAGKNLAEKFPGVRLAAPKEFPWGRELHIIDPAGVCWHVRESSV